MGIRGKLHEQSAMRGRYIELHGKNRVDVRHIYHRECKTYQQYQSLERGVSANLSNGLVSTHLVNPIIVMVVMELVAMTTMATPYIIHI